MTTKHATGFRAIETEKPSAELRPLGEHLFQIAFGAIQWPWLLKSLYGGTAAEKNAILDRIGLPHDALPNLGSWKADTYFLRRIVDEVSALKPANVVELGSGASSLVIAKALANNGGGTLDSYDQHEPFIAEMANWLGEHGLCANFHHAPLTHREPGWPGAWYSLSELPASIDMLVIDGPPWAIHPYVRGIAETLFDRITPGGVVLLDDAARPGERIVARRWRRNWPDFTFELETGGSKGLLVGRKAPVR